MRETLEAEFTRREMDCIRKAAASTEKELAGLEAKLQEEKSVALMNMKKGSEEKLCCSLKALSLSKDKEAQVAAQLAEKKALDMLDSALNAQIEKGKAEIEAIRLSQESLVCEAEKARDLAMMDLANAEERWLQREKDALILKENQVRNEMQILIDVANNEATEYMHLYAKENKLRKTIHNKLLDLQGNIRVFCRVRPILELEVKSGEDVDITSFPTDEDLIIR